MSQANFPEPSREDPDDHPIVRLLDQLPVIRFVCRLGPADAIVPLVVRAGDDFFKNGDVAERWRNLLERVHPDDRRHVQPPRAPDPVCQEIKLWRTGEGHRCYALAHHLRSADDHGRLWEGVLSKVVEGSLTDRVLSITRQLPGTLYRCIIVGRSTRCTFVSPAVTQLFGVSPTAFLDHPQGKFERVHPDDQAWLSDAWYMAAANLALFDREFRIVLPGGEERWIRSIAQMTKGEGDEVLADGIAVDITRRQRIQEQLERRNRELITLCRISEIALSSASVASGLNKIAGEIARHMGYPVTVIGIFDESAQVITLLGSRNPPGSSAVPSRAPIHETLAWEVIRTGKPLVATDIQTRGERCFTYAREAGNQTFIGVPIKIGDRAIGCLALAHTERFEPAPSSVELLSSWADYIASFIANKGQEELGPDRNGGRSLAFEAEFASRLTPRQRQVLAILASGRSNRSIAEQLGLQEATVKIHVRAILRTLGVRNRTQAAMIANSLERASAKPGSGKRPKRRRH